jgi:ABC-type molybdate transport system substrate-binding protein
MRPGGAGSLSAALDDVAAEVERTHRTRIEVVMVGTARSTTASARSCTRAGRRW